LFDYLEKRKTYFVYLPLIIYWLTIFVATSIPGESLPETGVSDKIEHLAAYFILSQFCSLLFLYQDKYLWIKKYHLVSALIVVFVYGAIDEIHQLFIPGRSCDLLDLTADTIGAIAGLLLLRYLLKKFKYKPKLSEV